MAARPAVRRPAGRPADAPTRPVVRDLTRGGVSYRIDWDVRTAFDFVFSLSGDAGSTEDLPAADRQWLPRQPEEPARRHPDRRPGPVRERAGDPHRDPPRRPAGDPDLGGLRRPRRRDVAPRPAQRALHRRLPRRRPRTELLEPGDRRRPVRRQASSRREAAGLAEEGPPGAPDGRRRHARADPGGAPGVAGEVQRDRAAGRSDPRARLRRASEPNATGSDRRT